MGRASDILKRRRASDLLKQHGVEFDAASPAPANLGSTRDTQVQLRELGLDKPTGRASSLLKQNGGVFDDAWQLSANFWDTRDKEVQFRESGLGRVSTAQIQEMSRENTL